MRPSLLAWTLPTLLIASTAAAQPAMPPLESKILRSRAQVRKALGAAAVQSVPEAFDFQLYALVWVDLRAHPDAPAKLVTLPADGPLSHSQSLGVALRATRTRSEIQVEIMVGQPCSGGMRQPPDVVADCRERVAQSAAAAKRTVTLLATPRAHLKRVRVTSRTLPPRP